MPATNVAVRGSRSLRIIALPLTRAPHNLTYYHFVTPPETKKSTSWTNRATAKASDIWAGFGKAAEGSWKRRAFLYGERIADRLDFEEHALRSLDPSLGPKLSDLIPQRSKTEDTPVVRITLTYPPSTLQSPLPHLHSLLSSRGPRHKKGFYTWLAVTPLTFPLKLIPIIPNFPFFFCAWRVWSHYRAYKSSEYLEALLQRGAIRPDPSSQLDAVYAKYSPSPCPPPTPPDSGSNDSKLTLGSSGLDEQLLLTRDAVPELQRTLALEHEDSTFAAGMYRALEQAQMRLGKTRR
ncbi:mitochondrial K+-H+ exchange-related-domain-containing protein [Cerioporus squamosus]|nr:mitochondrial K+-H+ exchange-related-domain-containing protein [Cerioporus squamosus]